MHCRLGFVICFVLFCFAVFVVFCCFLLLNEYLQLICFVFSILLIFVFLFLLLVYFSVFCVLKLDLLGFDIIYFCIFFFILVRIPCFFSLFFVYDCFVKFHIVLRFIIYPFGFESNVS